MHTVRRIVAFVVLACLFATPAFAQTYTYSVYIDSDVNSATGCSVTLPNGTFTGVESVLTATVATGSPPQVTSVTRSTCSGSTFGAPVAEGSGAVSVGAGNGGTTAIELTDAVSQLVPPGTQTARIYVVARSATGDDVLVATAGAAPIVVLFAQNVELITTPLFGIPALILFIGCLLAFGSRAARKRILKPLLLGLALFSGIAGAMIFPWNGLPPIATDPAGDTTSGEDAIDLRYFFVAVNDGYAFFRCDVVGNLSKPDHAPSFVKGADQTVLEDAAAQSVANWATAINDNDGNTQTLNFIISNNNNTLFSVQPAISPTGTLTYTLAPDANGTALVTVQLHDNGGTANGGVDTSAAQTFNINVTAVNDAPSFTKGADESVLEDSGAHSVASWTTAISAGPADEAVQTLNFIVSNNNNALFSVQPAIASNGTLTYTLAAGQKGAALVTVQLHDNGGTANGGVDTSVGQTFNINVSLVNHAPGFTKGADQTVLEDAAAQSLPNWATAINDNDGNTQTLNFIVSNSNNALFSVQPAISTTGTLTYTLAANANGTALVTVQLHDNGGTANGGVDTSAAQTFNVNVTAVNDAPSFTKGANENVLEGSGAHSVPGWATAISSGPPDESAQTVTFLVTGNTNSALFSVAPSVATDGTLSYTLATGAFGTSTITLVAKDTGGTANGGADTSAPQTFTISAAQLAPTVSAVLPASGPTAGGTTVAITGTDLTGATAVKFGAVAATSFTVNSATSITATAPAASAGTVDVTVTTSAGTSATNLADQYTYAGTPTVTGVAPTSGPTAGGTSVTITGTNLTGATAVKFGAVAAIAFTVNSASSITATAPAGAAGVVDVTVTTAGGTSATSAADQYTYMAAPTLTSVSPTGGPSAGGTIVTITGTNLTGAAAVIFGATPAASFTVNSATSITAVSPVGVGTVDVRVTTAGGTSATSGADQYTFFAPPGIASVIPAAGPTAGGTAVTINGTNLGGATTVTFGGTTALISTDTPTQITVTTPPHAAGAVDVVVTTPGGTATATNAYTYAVAPTAGDDTYSTVGNTALIVGVAPPTTPYVSSSTLLLGNDSTLGSPSITITQAPAGTISSLNAATGAFVYTPPAGFTGTDTFKYTVTDASTLTSAPATVSIGVSSRVWYVNGAAGAGNGTSASPFNTLAVSPPFAAGDTVFVESGATQTSTSGVITLTAGVTLWGQGTSLPAISGIAIANTAATSKPIVTSTVVLGGSNTTISSLDINTSGTQGLVTSGGPYSGVSIANDVTVTSSGATAVTLTSVSGSLSFRKIAASGVGAGVGISLTNIGGAGFSVTGDGATAGSGGVISGTCTTGVTGCAGVVLANAGVVSLAWMNLTSSTGSGIWATDTNATVAKTSLTNFAVVGIRIAAASLASGSFNLHDNTMTGIGGDAIQLQLNGTATWTGHVKANLIGNSGVANSGSAGGNGIDVDVAGGGTATVDVSNNQINQIHANYGIRATATSGTLNASVQGNTIAMAQPTGIDGITVLSSATICLNATGNSAAAAGLAVQNGLFDGVGMSVLQNTSTSVFKIQGYSVSNDTGVQNYLVSSNTSFSGPGGATFADSASAGNPGFANAASCPIAP